LLARKGLRTGKKVSSPRDARVGGRGDVPGCCGTPRSLRLARVARWEHEAMTATMTDRAAVLIDELDLYPDERAEIIFELAAELERAARPEAALEWLRRLVEDGGADGALARVEIASLHYAADHADLAEAELSKLMAARLSDAMPYLSAGELLVERGDDEAAVRWFTMAALRLTDAERAAARGEHGWMSWGYSVLWQRREARERLGLAPDDLDAGLLEPPGRRMSSFPSLEQARDDGRAQRARLVRILVWPQAEFAIAQQRWPDLLDANVSFEQYRAQTESHMREIAVGCTRIQLLEARVPAMQAYADRVGGPIADPDVRRGYLDDRAKHGHVVAWPPGRNASCWCGSRVKYKKCCGRPGS
jgi:SEC-C motif